MKPDLPDMIGPEGNLQLSQDLGGFLQAPLKLTTQRHLVLEHFVKKLRTAVKNWLILILMLQLFAQTRISDRK